MVPTVGIVFSNGPRWRALRSFALKALRELGVGTRTIEDVPEELRDAVSNLGTGEAG